MPDNNDKGFHISGIPGPAGFSQIEDAGAEPIRDENNRVDADSDDAEQYAVDYFDSEEERLKRIAGSEGYARNDDWAPDGVTDEANQMAESEWAGAPYKDEDSAEPNTDIAWAEKGDESIDLQRRSTDF